MRWRFPVEGWASGVFGVCNCISLLFSHRSFYRARKAQPHRDPETVLLRDVTREVLNSVTLRGAL